MAPSVTNVPLRSSESSKVSTTSISLYQGQFIISGEQSFYGRSTGIQDLLLNHVDVAPTTLWLCGLPIPHWMEGHNFSSYRTRRGDLTVADSLFLQSVIPTGHGDSIEFAWRGVVTGDGWKYVAFDGQPWLLFNLHENPCEQVNLAYNSNYARIHSRLNDRFRAWMTDTDDAFNLPRFS
jgi:arylsulfatase A-like enzyme